MNEFTREELYSIESTILNLRIYMDMNCWDEELLSKVQSMIANYCDHEYQYNTYDNTFGCKKCISFFIPSQS